ncbi:MAG: ral nucleoside transport system permease protein, partial [Thermoleophilaceae bacterium]|nr:ral nucleoside transport system permease protein [Thermoleophilaceae bacterium]
MEEGLLIASIATTLGAATPVLIASVGELLSERVGVYNFGIEGTMLLGALVGFTSANAAGSWVVGLMVAALLGAVVSLVYAFAVVAARANSVVVGIAVWFIALGLAGQLGKSQVRKQGESLIGDWNLPLLSDIP